MNTALTSTASRQPAVCWRRSGRPRPSCPNARARITSPPTTPVRVPQRPTPHAGGTSQETRRYPRLLYYDVADRERPKLAREYVVPLPLFETADGQRRVAAQSEVHRLDGPFFLASR